MREQRLDEAKSWSGENEPVRRKTLIVGLVPLVSGDMKISIGEASGKKGGMGR